MVSLYRKLSPFPLYLSSSVYIFERFAISLPYVAVAVDVAVGVAAGVAVGTTVLSLSSSSIGFGDANPIEGTGDAERVREVEGCGVLRAVDPNTT